MLAAGTLREKFDESGSDSELISEGACWFPFLDHSLHLQADPLAWQ